METIIYYPIGVIHSPFSELSNMPIQPGGAKGIEGSVEIFPEYQNGLKDLDGFSHIILLYHFHGSRGFNLEVIPFLDNTPRGVFSTRAPKRPNAIGLSIIKLQKIRDNILYIENVDILDGTPLLDLKPYVPKFDEQADVRAGWFEKSSKNVTQTKSDQRFI